MTAKTTTATEALRAARADRNKMKVSASAFVCPHPDCRTYAQHTWGALNQVSLVVDAYTFNRAGLASGDPELHAALCSACNRETLFLNGKLIVPATSEAPPPSEDMPAAIAAEYDEAAAILNLSPRGSAALLRLAVQKLLPELGAKVDTIDRMIAELVGNGTISARVQGALDTLRVIGNEAVHPGTIDLNDDPETAVGLFRLLNLIITKAISEPRHADEMFALLPANKVDGIKQRNARATGSAGKAEPDSAG